MTATSRPPPAESRDRSSVDLITDQMAMQHELDTLRHSLSAKSKKLDATTTAFRELEDKLEDQHHAYDALRKQYKSRKRALNAALKKLSQLQDQQADGHASRASRMAFARSRRDEGEAAVIDSAPQASAASKPFLQGLAAGVFIALLLAAIGIFLWRAELLPWSPLKLTPPPAVSSTAAPASEPIVVETKAPIAADGGVTAAPKAPPKVRDRLRNGTSGPLMAVIPPGEFTMGTRGFVSGSGSGEHPAHSVQIRGFLIGVNEVAFAEYDRFARATGRRSPNDFGGGRGDHPVVDVSWADALDYTGWLTSQTGRRYRLPSEAEWEYAARAGTESAYWWGHNLEPGKALCFDCGGSRGIRSSVPGGSFPANPFGLHDTAGNVLEWVQDCYHPSYHGAPTDGHARADDSCTERVARGGAFNKPGTSLRSAARHRFAPDIRINMIGFRVARDN